VFVKFARKYRNALLNEAFPYGSKRRLLMSKIKVLAIAAALAMAAATGASAQGSSASPGTSASPAANSQSSGGPGTHAGAPRTGSGANTQKVDHNKNGYSRQ
jgi:hypothetical protein